MWLSSSSKREVSFSASPNVPPFGLLPDAGGAVHTHALGHVVRPLGATAVGLDEVVAKLLLATLAAPASSSSTVATAGAIALRRV